MCSGMMLIVENKRIGKIYAGARECSWQVRGRDRSRDTLGMAGIWPQEGSVRDSL